MSEPTRRAIIYEADQSGQSITLSYQTLLEYVCRFSHVLTHLGVQQGDTVIIYLQMIPRTIVALLACARIEAFYSCVFSGFSSVALRDRIIECALKVIVTADQGLRVGKVLLLKSIANQALKLHTNPVNVVVFARTSGKVSSQDGRDHW